MYLFDFVLHPLVCDLCPLLDAREYFWEVLSFKAVQLRKRGIEKIHVKQLTETLYRMRLRDWYTMGPSSQSPFSKSTLSSSSVA